MVAAAKKKRKKKTVLKPVKAGFVSSLDALKEMVGVVVEGKSASVGLLDQVRFYIENLQTSADMVNLVLFQHGIQKHREILEGISIIHKELLDPDKLKKKVEGDWEYGKDLLKILYKEASMATAHMEAKSSLLFEAEGLKKSALLAEGGDSAGMHDASKLSVSNREKLRNIITKLLNERTRES